MLKSFIFKTDASWGAGYRHYPEYEVSLTYEGGHIVLIPKYGNDRADKLLALDKKGVERLLMALHELHIQMKSEV